VCGLLPAPASHGGLIPDRSTHAVLRQVAVAAAPRAWAGPNWPAG